MYNWVPPIAFKPVGKETHVKKPTSEERIRRCQVRRHFKTTRVPRHHRTARSFILTHYHGPHELAVLSAADGM